MGVRDHPRVGAPHGIFAASLALLVGGIPPWDRRVLLALASVPTVANALGDARER